MRSHLSCLMILGVLPSLLEPAARSQTESSPVVAGYITAVGPAGAFAVAGKQVRLAPSTILSEKTGHTAATVPSLAELYLGEEMDVYGAFSKKSGAIEATRVVAYPVVPGTVHGTAIVDLVPVVTSATPDRIVRADGYLLHLTPKSSVLYNAPLKSADDLKTNLWVTYRGVQLNDGTVAVDSATFSVNTVRHTEDKLRDKTEYDPTAVDPDKQQSGVSKAFLGIDPRRIPPYLNPAMQERVTRIGESLIPAFQRALRDSDPTKIDFRFHLIDSKKYHDALSLPSGIILVPRQVVERLQNDAQLAEVLADNIAEVMEKQTIRLVPTSNSLNAAAIAGDIGGIFVPGLGLATGIAAGRVGAHMVALNLQQSGRVSLFLLRDAGYDITQAPLAWWLLAPSKPKPINKVTLPPRAANLYMALGTTWHDTLRSPAPQSNYAKRTK